MRCQVEDDLILAVVDGLAPGLPLPAALHGTPPARLRLIGNELVDVSSRTAWHIDARGRKRVAPGDDRQPLSCAWDARLVRDGGHWRAEEPADRRAPALNAECRDRILSVLSESTQRNFTAYGAELAFKAATGEALDAEEVADAAVLRAAREWTVDMLSACRAAIETNADPEWPAVPDGVIDLAAIF